MFTVISTYQYPEIAPCYRNFQVFPFTFIFFSRRLSSQVAGSGGGTGGVGPARNDLYLQELCGNTQHLQLQPMYLVLHGCVCSLVALCPSELISLRPKSPRQPQPRSQGAGCLLTHKNWGITRPKGGCYLPVWTFLQVWLSMASSSTRNISWQFNHRLTLLFLITTEYSPFKKSKPERHPGPLHCVFEGQPCPGGAPGLISSGCVVWFPMKGPQPQGSSTGLGWALGCKFHGAALQGSASMWKGLSQSTGDDFAE